VEKWALAGPLLPNRWLAATELQTRPRGVASIPTSSLPSPPVLRYYIHFIESSFPDLASSETFPLVNHHDCDVSRLRSLRISVSTEAYLVVSMIDRLYMLGCIFFHIFQ
jgi:hypothetical protein